MLHGTLRVPGLWDPDYTSWLSSLYYIRGGGGGGEAGVGRQGMLRCPAFLLERLLRSMGGTCGTSAAVQRAALGKKVWQKQTEPNKVLPGWQAHKARSHMILSRQTYRSDPGSGSHQCSPGSPPMPHLSASVFPTSRVLGLIPTVYSTISGLEFSPPHPLFLLRQGLRFI